MLTPYGLKELVRTGRVAMTAAASTVGAPSNGRSATGTARPGERQAVKVGSLFRTLADAG
jgi:hypothetical protein